MKQSLLLSVLLIFAFGSMITSCTTPAEKVENAEAEVTEAEENLAEVQRNYQNDVEQFRQRSNEQIASNRREIAEFNARAENEKKQIKADYKERIAELERQNSEMEMKMNGYRAESSDNWENFKTEFNRDMDQLGSALRDLTVDNSRNN